MLRQLFNAFRAIVENFLSANNPATCLSFTRPALRWNVLFNCLCDPLLYQFATECLILWPHLINLCDKLFQFLCFKSRRKINNYSSFWDNDLFTSSGTPPVSFLITNPQNTIATYKMWAAGRTKTTAGFCMTPRDEFIAFCRRWMNDESFEIIDPEANKSRNYYQCFGDWVSIFNSGIFSWNNLSGLSEKFSNHAHASRAKFFQSFHHICNSLT